MNEDNRSEYHRAWAEANAVKVAERKRSWYQRNKKASKEAAARWREKNPQRLIEIHRKHKYGITAEEFKELLEQQGGRCAGCSATEKLVVDHCHSTDVIRGLLCGACNFAIGHAKDNAQTLRRLADYLDDVQGL